MSGVEKGVETEKDALAGALDIIAEEISDRADIRGWLRNFVLNKGLIVSEAKKEWKGECNTIKK